MAASKLYKEKIIDHYKNPRNYGELKRPDYKAQVANTVCGDEVTVYLREKKGKISEVGYKGTGCAISVAGSSMLSEQLIGLTKEEINELDNEYVLGLLGMQPRSPRVKCATLFLEAAKRAVKEEEDDPCDFC